MSAPAPSIAIPPMDKIEQHGSHLENVIRLADELVKHQYTNDSWTTGSDGGSVAPNGIVNVVNQVYRSLRNHPLIGKYVIPESQVNNRNWLGVMSDPILSHPHATDVTAKKISREMAVMAASLFLRQKYLEILGDILLWNMGADPDNGSSEIHAPVPTYNPKAGLPRSALGNYDDGEEQPDARKFFLQNIKDYRLLHPHAIRALAGGNYLINKDAQPARVEGMTMGGNQTEPFGGMSGFENMAVTMFGIQYQPISVQPVVSARSSSAEPDDKIAPPSYEETNMIDVCPQMGFLAFYRENGTFLGFAETGALTFIRQPHITGQSTTIEEVKVPSRDFFSGTKYVTSLDAVTLWATTPLAIVGPFSQIRDRIVAQAFASSVTLSHPASKHFEDLVATANRVNLRGVNPIVNLVPGSTTVIRFNYENTFNKVNARHFAVATLKGSYNKTQNLENDLYMYTLTHYRDEAVQQDKIRRARNHRSCGEDLDAFCCWFWCGGRKWIDNGSCICDAPKRGICGIFVCGCCGLLPLCECLGNCCC